MTRHMRWLALGACIASTIGFASGVNAGEPESKLEREARLARRGAGLRVGNWFVAKSDQADQVEESSSLLFEGFFQKGLDRHLVWVNNVGFWKRTQRFESSGGLTGETTTEKVDAYMVPMFTALKLYPVTGPDRPLQPFLDGGAGFAVGIENRSSDGGGFVGGGSGATTNVGFGFHFGTGFDLWLGKMFGFSGQFRYQWIYFTQELGGQQTYEGLGLDLGLNYRFQY